MRKLLFFVLAAAALSSCAAASTINLINNGGFEKGTLAGWTYGGSGDAGNGYAIQGNSGQASLSTFPVVGPASGSFYAMSDSYGAGYRYLAQTFTFGGGKGPVLLSFDMFVNHYADYANDGNGLNSTTPDNGNFARELWNGFLDPQFANQYARVDLLAAGADPITGSSIHTFYLGVDGATGNVNPFTYYSFDISPYLVAGNSYQIRFADVAGSYYQQVGVDNVSVLAPVPEPTSIMLLSMGGMGVAGLIRRKRR